MGVVGNLERKKEKEKGGGLTLFYLVVIVVLGGHNRRLSSGSSNRGLWRLLCPGLPPSGGSLPRVVIRLEEI